MRTVIYSNYGPPSVLKLKEQEKPAPKDNEILVKIMATTVATADIRIRKADPWVARLVYGLTSPKKQILGIEFAGIVEETGKNVTLFKKDDEIFGSAGFDFGTYAEYRCFPENGVISHKPKNISFEEAATIPFGGLTSLYFLQNGNVKKGDKVLIHGASGSLGAAAVQIANDLGAEVTAVCSGSNAELVRSLGAHFTVDYTKEDFTKNGKKYDVIYCTVGKSPFKGCVKSLKDGGRYLRAVHHNPVDFFKGLWTNLTTKVKVTGGIVKETRENLNLLASKIEKGKYRAVIDRIYPLEETAAAHEYVEKGHKKGNVVIKIHE